MKKNKNTHDQKHIWRLAFPAAVLYGLWKFSGPIKVGILCLCQKVPFLMPGEASSVGIIGGADGPTAVFVTGMGRNSWLVPLLLAAAGLLVFSYFGSNRK